MSDYLSGIENNFARRNDTKSASALIMAYWIKYELSGDIGFLNKAFHRAQVSLRDNFACVELVFYKTFITIYRDEYNDAGELIAKITPHKNYYKNANPLYFEIYLFLNSLLETKMENNRAANKFYKMLDELYKESTEYELPLMMGILKFEAGEINEAGKFFYDSFQKGCRSSMLFVYFNKYLLSFNQLKQESSLLGTFIRWGVRHDAKLSKILGFYKEYVTALLYFNPQIIDTVFSVYKEEWLLTEICKYFIKKTDYSESAYKYFREAESKQLEITNLSNHLINCAFRNKSRDISRYAMEVFLKNFKSKDSDNGLKSFVFHMLLVNKKFAGLDEGFYDEILKFSISCLENDITGRYYNSIYKFFLEVNYSSNKVLKKIPLEYISKAENFVFSDLFAYEIVPANPSVKQVWIIEKEKKEMSYYSIEDGRALIKASSGMFSYVCFGSNSKNITESKLQITKLVENVDTGLFMYFYKKKKINTDLLINLAKHFLSSDKKSEDGEKIIKQMAMNDEISNTFRIQLYAALGNYSFQKNDMHNALEYYLKVDDNYVSDKHIEQILIVFMHAGEFERACMLITKKERCISDKALFSALKQLAGIETYRPFIANTAYDLLIKSWYDKTLLDTVLKHCNANQDEWQDLSRALANISVFDIELDEIILRNVIWMHKLDEGAQKVFTRMYENAPNNPIIESFAYYCVYEIITSNRRLEYDTIAIIEKVFNRTKEKIYAYGLSNLYLNHSISTLKSDDIIEAALSYAVEDGLIFPVFKTYKDKRNTSPYIEQNRPFFYKCLQKKNVMLYYRVDDEKDFRSVKMKYFRFGLYYANLSHFYGEKLYYYFSEEMDTGSVTTKESVIENNSVNIYEEDKHADITYKRFFDINNALIYEQMFKFDMVENIITESLKDLRKVKGGIL